MFRGCFLRPQLTELLKVNGHRFFAVPFSCKTAEKILLILSLRRVPSGKVLKSAVYPGVF